ncbi:hypothetical protein LINGRAHAP2_LOCUS14965 [Linum grandiflorum]
MVHREKAELLCQANALSQVFRRDKI